MKKESFVTASIDGLDPNNASQGSSKETWAVPAFGAGIGLTVVVTLLAGGSGKIALAAGLASSAGIALILLPIRDSLFLYFVYLLLDGAIKINSDYNPVLHVAQDLLLVLLAARSCQGKEGGFAKVASTPHIGACVLLLLWILLQYVNPFGLGLLPSIAGTKLYISMLCLFFLVYHHISRVDLPRLLRWILCLATLEGALATIEYLYGQKWMLALHPRYREMIEQQFGGIFYRPFGTTAVPGGPAVWIMLAAPIAGYLLESAKRPVLDRVLPVVFVVTALPALIFCQVRVAILISAVGFIMPLLRPSIRMLPKAFSGLALMALCGFVVTQNFNSNSAEGYAWVTRLSPAQREHLFLRMTSLGNTKTYVEARGGALQEALVLADTTWLGIGLSRVGAASAIWQSRIRQDPYFGVRWTFADNLFKAIFTEIGIFGLGAWLFFVCAILFRLFSRALKAAPGRDRSLVWMTATFGALLVLSGVGNEGVLYNPVSGIFWTFLAIGSKEASYAAG